MSEEEYVAEYSGRLEQQLAASEMSEEKKTEQRQRQRQIRQAHVRFGVTAGDVAETAARYAAARAERDRQD